jgi:hypothetical protein
MAIHAVVQFPETLEQTARPSGLPRACGPRNDESLESCGKNCCPQGCCPQGCRPQDRACGSRNAALGRDRKNKGKRARNLDGETKKREGTGKPGKEKEY